MQDSDIHSKALVDYLEIYSEQETELLKKVKEFTLSQVSRAHMISGHYQGRFLSLMSKVIQPQKILEVGTYTGYATLCLAEGLRENGRIITLDKDEKMKDIYQPFFIESRYKDSIEAIIVDAKEYLEKNPNDYDLIFLDANKSQYINYYELLIPHLKSGSVLLADNTLWKLKVLDDNKDKMTTYLHDFNKHVAVDSRVEKVILPIRDGITLIRKK